MSKINIQDQLLHQARKDRLPVKIFLMKGLQLQGKITGYDMYSVLLEGQGRVQLIFKHAISTIEFPEKMRFSLDPEAQPGAKAAPRIDDSGKGGNSRKVPASKEAEA